MGVPLASPGVEASGRPQQSCVAKDAADGRGVALSGSGDDLASPSRTTTGAATAVGSLPRNHERRRRDHAVMGPLADVRQFETKSRHIKGEGGDFLRRRGAPQREYVPTSRN